MDIFQKILIVRFIVQLISYTVVRKKKEVTDMTNNKNRLHANDYPVYPGAATPRYFKEKILQTVTAIASGMGCVTVLLFFLLL